CSPRRPTFMRFTPHFDEVFRSDGIQVIKAPVRAPKARAHAERWIGSVRRECLDRLLILGRRHLQHVLVAYVRHFNEHRPHRALGQRPPLNDEQPVAAVIDLDRLRRRDLLGGLTHESQRAAHPQSPGVPVDAPVPSLRPLPRAASRLAIRTPMKCAPDATTPPEAGPPFEPDNRHPQASKSLYSSQELPVCPWC